MTIDIIKDEIQKLLSRLMGTPSKIEILKDHKDDYRIYIVTDIHCASDDLTKLQDYLLFK